MHGFDIDAGALKRSSGIFAGLQVTRPEHFGLSEAGAETIRRAQVRSLRPVRDLHSWLEKTRRRPPEHQEWFSALRRVSASPENAARIMEACDKINVRALLPSVSVPTIVFHSDGDRAVPPDEGRILAAEIPNARFVPLSSANHLLLADEPAWGIFVQELGAFLGWQDADAATK
jgi:pimeloyl-ACP methyl ester carboxylesterase